MNEKERNRIIASKITEILGIICEGLGNQYDVFIETDTKINIKDKREAGVPLNRRLVKNKGLCVHVPDENFKCRKCGEDMLGGVE